jgi:hypothetical protein
LQLNVLICQCQGLQFLKEVLIWCSTEFSIEYKV